MTTVTAYNKYLDARLEVVGSYNRLGEDRLIYADALPAFANTLKRRIRDHHQNVIVVTGGTGSGKSTIAIQICMALAKSMEMKWGLKDNYIYSVDDLKTALKYRDTMRINLFDEGSVSLNSNNSQRSEDKMMVLLFDTMRSLGWTSVICIPHINSLNKRVRLYHMDYHVLCPNQPILRGFDNRGFAQIYKHTQRDFALPYDKLIATTTFKPLKPSVQREYDTIKRDHQDLLLDRFLNGDDDL